MGLCFIEDNNYREFFKNERIVSMPGNVVDKNGAILGKHNGIMNYTIGQRRGLGINLNFPVFVSELRLDANEIVLSKYDDLYRNRMMIKDYQCIDIEEIKMNRI